MPSLRVFNAYEPVTTLYRDLLPYWTAGGWTPEVVISRRDYRAGRDRSWAGPGVRVVSTPAAERRGLSLVLYALAAAARSLFGRRVDLNLFLTQPPLFFIWGWWLRVVRRQPYAVMLMDLYPDVAVLGGVLGAGGPLTRALATVSRFGLRKAAGVIVIGRCQAELLRAMGVVDDRIYLVPNWTDETRVRPVAPEANRFRQEQGWGGRFVVMYSGNAGASHRFDDFLEVARRMAARPDVVFAVIGGGKRLPEIEAYVAAHGLANVAVLPFQPQERLAESLSAGDVHFVSLRAGFEGRVVPSKAYGILAAGRPIVYQGRAEGEIARLVVEEGVGRVVPEGDAEALEAAIAGYAADPGLRAKHGRRARALAEGEYGRAAACDRYTRALEAILTRR